MITDDFLRRYQEYVGKLVVCRCVKCVFFVSLVQVIMHALVVTHIPFPAFLKIIFTFLIFMEEKVSFCRRNYTMF